MEDNNSTFPEAPVSVSVTGYYKGFSVIATKRKPDEKLSPLLQDAMSAIDWMSQNGWKPSWRNEEGNASAQQANNQTANKIQCPIHSGLHLYLNSKNGRSWYSHKLQEGGYCNGKASQQAGARDFDF